MRKIELKEFRASFREAFKKHGIELGGARSPYQFSIERPDLQDCAALRRYVERFGPDVFFKVCFRKALERLREDDITVYLWTSELKENRILGYCIVDNKRAMVVKSMLANYQKEGIVTQFLEQELKKLLS